MLYRSGIFFVLTFALLAQSAWGQRLGPLVKDNQQRSNAAAVQPPSLQLSLPSPAVAALPPLGPDDLQLLQPQEGQPPVIGIHRQLPQGSVELSFSGGTARTTVEGAWQSIPAGRLWRLRITSPSARAMRVHFRDFAIGAGKLWLYSADGQAVPPYTGSGLYGDGNFWSDIVFGDSLTIEYLPDPAATEEAVPFQIVEISHIWDDAFGSGGEADVQPPIAASGEARTGREALKPLTDRINVVVGRQSMEQSPAADNPPDTKTARLAKQIQSVERSASLDHPLPKAATTLSPGQPTTFSRGPVDSLTLFHGDHSFQLLVPESATSVTVTLESSVDLDLYVRYGEDNDVRDGSIVSDYSSDGLTGNEEIVITPQSDPPLRAGTYFVSVALFETGVVAMATLTAEVERDDTPLPPISGGPLTPGQPSAFRLGPVESSTFFTGDHSFRLEVPENASRVIFTLESVDPDVDVDLFVRFGENNTIQFVADYSSRSDTGNERIGITYRSDPPLRAGTYFVSVLVFDTGVVAEGTITATVETDAMDCHLDVTCYPEWSSSAAGAAYFVYERSEGSFSCSGTLLNNTREDFTPYFLTASHCVATEEEARSVMAFWHYQTQTCNGELPDFLSVPRTMGASLLSTLGGGTIEGRPHPDGDMTLLRIEGDLPDGVMFQGWDASPQPFGTQVTGIHHPGNRDWGFFKRISFGQIIPDPDSETSADVYAIVSWPQGQGYTEGGSSGSALFSSPGTVVGADSFIYGGLAEAENACRTGSALLSGYTHFSVFYPHIRQFIDKEFAGTESILLANFVNGNTDAFNSRVYLWNPSGSSGDVTVRVFTLPLTGGLAQELTTAPLNLGTLGAKSALNVKVAEDILAPLGITLPYTNNEGDLTLEFTIEVADVRGATQVFSPSLAFGTHPLQEIPSTSSGSPTVLVANFMNGNTDAFNSRAHLFNPSDSDGNVTVRVFTLPLSDGTAQELTGPPLDLGTLEARSALNIKLAEDILTPLGITTPYTTDGGNLTLEFTIQAADVRGAAQVFSSSFAFGVYPLQEIPSTSSGSPTVLVANFMNGNSDAFSSRAYLFNPSDSDGNVTVRVFTLPLTTGIARELTGPPLDLGTLEARSALNLKLVEDILIPLGITLPYTTDGGNLTLEFTIQAADVRGTAQVFSSSFAFGTYPLQQLPLVSVGTPTGLVANFMNGNNTAFHSRVYLWNPSESSGDVTVRVFTLPLTGGLAQELTTAPLNLGTLGAKSALNVKLVENILAPLGITLPYTTDGGNLTLEFTIQAADVRGAAQVFSSSFAFGTYPLQNVELITDGGDVPPTPLAPADEAAFNTLFVGKRAVTNYPTVYVDFVSPGRFRETEGSDIWTGSYTYRNTGSNTGTLTLNYDDGDRCTVSLTFDSTTAGTASYTCNDGSSGEYNWQLVAISATGAPDLVVQTSSVSDSNPNAGESFTLSATVRNQGNSLSASTTLRYYRSSDATISTGDTQVGTDTVSALTPAGASDGSISLTAPSTAGTYYYGACVDPVSGESNSQNNCSTAVRVTVSASQMEIADFDLASANGDAQGIVFANNRFFVPDATDDKVYAYQSSGQRDSASEFDLDSANGDARGITFANNRFYVVDGTDDKVYAYHATGQRESSADFDLHADNADLGGITFANSRFFVVDFADDKVYAYSASGQRESAAGFDLHADNEWQAGITFANNRFFVPDATDDKVYAYSASGQRESSADFALHVDSGNPRGITFTNNRFFVVDTTDDKVYVLNPTAPDLVVESPSVSSSTPATGQSFEFRATVRNQGPSTSTATTLRYYRSTNSTISTSDTQVGTDAVGALSRQATSAETIMLTAPSAAGTYYYGACVDPVAEETGTGNNCSSAVRVTVSSGGGVNIPRSPSVTTRFSPSQPTVGQPVQFILDWDGVAGATSYKVRVNQFIPIFFTRHPDGSCTVPSSVTTHETSYTYEFTASFQNQLYYTVQACNSAGCSCPPG